MNGSPSRRDLEITAEDVRHEHMGEVDTRAHALYLAAVLIGAFVLMLALMVALDTLA